MDRAWARPVLVLVSTMLGAASTVPERWRSSVAHVLELPCCVGGVGGRPRSSWFLAGVRGERVLYLDPHVGGGQRWSDPGGADGLGSYRVDRVRQVGIAELDPTMAMGFLVSSEADLRLLMEHAKKAEEEEGRGGGGVGGAGASWLSLFTISERQEEEEGAAAAAAAVEAVEAEAGGDDRGRGSRGRETGRGDGDGSESFSDEEWTVV